MQNEFAQTINEVRSPVFLAAVSGGVDSMVMADLFLKTCGPSGFVIAHCNFHLRGEESDADEALVAGWASDHGVRIHTMGFDTQAYASRTGLSIEMAARELRYRWFANLCIDNGYAATAIAHNANDNAETLMLNLLRGTGLDGLTGMSAMSDFPLEEFSGKVRLVRPLLKATRKQIEGYALAWNIKYRNDSTNFLSDYKRNRLRNEVFPHFAKINPSFIRSLNKDMEYFSQAAGIVRDWCNEAARGIVSHVDGSFGPGVSIDLKKLMEHEQWRYLLYHLLKPYGFNSAVLSSVEDLLASERTVPGKRFESPTDVIMTGRGEISIFKRKNIEGPDAVMPVRCDGTYHFNGRTIKVETLEWKKNMPLRQPEGVLVLDASTLPFPFVLRRWRAGDWMVPFGMKGRKLLSDMFTDMKYDSASKAAAVVALDVQSDGTASSQHIAALVGKRIDEGCRIVPSTSVVLRISEV